jgi:hypothetical protein
MTFMTLMTAMTMNCRGSLKGYAALSGQILTQFHVRIHVTS